MKNGVRTALVSVALAAFFLVGGALAAERPDAARDLTSLQRQLPAGLFPAVVHALQAEDADAYRVSRAASSGAVAYRARNAAHGMAVAFAPEGVRVSLLDGADWTWGLTLSGYGREGVMRPVSQGRLQASGNRVEYAYAEGVTAWYVNGPLGLQQGFTLARRPVGGAGELEVRLGLSGAVSAEVSSDGRSALLRQVGGGESRRYGGLYVYDARGKELSARLSSGPGGLSIRVDDRGAQYPIVIDPFVEEAKLTPSDGAPHHSAGYSVSVSGDTVVVGAYRDDDSGTASGSAYVFEKSSGGWTEVAKLTASDAAAHDEFGVSVSVSGATVVVGARLDDDNGLSSGSAYVFEKPSGGWMDATQTAKLTASDAAAHDWFGWSVSVSGDTIVAGAYGGDDNGTDSGSAYVFEKPSGGWMDATQTARLTASDAAADDHFGYSVSVSDATVVVGAYGNEGNGPRSGSAYVFEKPAGGWMDATQTAKLTASDGAADDVFGVSVSVSGATVVVGANWDDDNGSGSGSAYVFEKPVGGWADATQTAKLTASDGAASDRFGVSVSVSVSGDTIVVGAHMDDDNGINSGSAYVFEKPVGGWTDATETAKLTAFDGAAYNYFGMSVSVSGDTVVAGAHWADDNGINSGSAYVFERPMSPDAGSGLPEALHRPPQQYPRLTSLLNRLATEVEAGVADPHDHAEQAPLYHEDRVGVRVNFQETTALWPFLAAHGVAIRHEWADHIEAFVPIHLLGPLSEVDGVFGVRPLHPPRTHTIVTDTDLKMNEGAWRDGGYTGQGVKVGVIDAGGFSDWDRAHGENRLPPKSEVHARCYTVAYMPTTNMSYCETGTHGTAVAEAVLQVAPAVDLYIANIITKGDLQDAAQWMAGEGVSVINFSGTFPWDGPGDGTSEDDYSPLWTVHIAVDAGVVWINAAGNEGQRSWMGTTSDKSFDDVRFSGTDETNSIWLKEGDKIDTVLRRQDDWPDQNGRGGAQTDLALFLYSASDDWIVVYSNDLQDGWDGNRPWEYLTYTAPHDGEYYFKIDVGENSVPRKVQMVTYVREISGAAGSTYRIYEHHNGGGTESPAESANPGMLTVGAANVVTLNLEPYSNRGPTFDGRTKPDIVGPTDTYSSALQRTFGGTSAASPHVAGLAALLRGRWPQLSPEEVVSDLKTYAARRAGYGEVPNNNVGWGYARLPTLPSPRKPRSSDEFPESPLVLYQHSLSDESGWEIEEPGPVEVNQIDIWFGGAYDDQISSLIVGDGYTVELFQNADFEGTRLTYHGPRMIDAGELVDYGMAGQISSYKLYATPPLVLRQHPLGNGSGWEITETGLAEVSFVGWPKNDQVSSLIVGDGYTVEIFRNGGFGGTRLTYHGPQSIDIGLLDRYGMNDQISSYKLYATPPLVLRQHGLSHGGGWEIVETGPVDVPAMGPGEGDQISTIVVGDGYTVEVFRHPDFQGTQLTYRGPRTIRVGELSQHGMHDQISSYKLYVTPLVLRQHPLSNPSGWEIAETGPVEVLGMSAAEGDQISAIVVGDGYTVEVFRHPDFQGTQLTYDGPRSIDVGELSQHGMNDQISSYKLYVTPPVLVLRQHPLSHPGGWEITETRPVEVPAMGPGEGDQISAIVVGDGYTVQVFSHPDFQGAQLIYTGPQSIDVWDLAELGMNDQISSYRLYATP